MSDCLFCKIANKEIPADIIYEDELCLGFKDIHPSAPVHILFIPREHFASALDIGEKREKLAGHLVGAAAKTAKKMGVAEGGFRLVMNTNKDAGQVIFHLHLHLLAGRALDKMG